jgi:hypothetical protein
MPPIALVNTGSPVRGVHPVNNPCCIYVCMRVWGLGFRVYGLGSPQPQTHSHTHIPRTHTHTRTNTHHLPVYLCAITSPQHTHTKTHTNTHTHTHTHHLPAVFARDHVPRPASLESQKQQGRGLIMKKRLFP